MNIAFTKKEFIFLIVCAVLTLASILMQSGYEASKEMYNQEQSRTNIYSGYFSEEMFPEGLFSEDLIKGLSVDESYRQESTHLGQVLLSNYFLVAFHLAVFAILIAYIVKLAALYVKSTAFLKLYNSEQHGKISGLTDYDDWEKEELITGFEKTQDLLEPANTLALASILMFIAVMFCALYNPFKSGKGMNLWSVNPPRAARLSLFPAWAFEAMFIPNLDLSDYAICWEAPMFAAVIILTVFAYNRFFSAKKGFCSVFPEVPEEGLFVAMIIKKSLHPDLSPQKPLFDTDTDSIIQKEKKKTILFQEDFDKDGENLFSEFASFAANSESPSPIPVPADELIYSQNRKEEENDEQEMIPDSWDLSKLKMQPSELKAAENTVVCPLCGMENPPNTAECNFCGGSLDE